jgi:hypothetical protein
MLEIQTVAEHDGDIFCKQCYTRKFGIRGVGFGIGAGALGMDSGERFGNSQNQLYVLFLPFDLFYKLSFFVSFRNRPNFPPMPNLPPQNN